jgi:hypothetical protein
MRSSSRGGSSVPRSKSDVTWEYRRQVRRAPVITVLAGAATAGYLAGITGPGSSLRGPR